MNTLTPASLALRLHEMAKDIPGYAHASADVKCTIGSGAPYFFMTLFVNVNGLLRCTKAHPFDSLEEAEREAFHEMEVILKAAMKKPSGRKPKIKAKAIKAVKA